MNSKIIVRFLRFSFPFIILGALLKIMHWPYSQIIMTIGFAIILILYPIRFYLKPQKRIIDYVKLIFLIVFPISRYLRIFHLPSHYLLEIMAFILFVLWILLELLDKYNKRLETDQFKVFPFPIISVITLFLFLGVFYQLINSPYATPILIVGFIFLTIYFLIESFKK